MVDATEHQKRADHQHRENRPNALLRHMPPLRFIVTAMPTQTLDGTQALSRRGGHCGGEIRRPLHHPRPGEGEVVLAGTAHDDVVQDADADVLQSLSDLVGSLDVLFGRIALLSGARPCRHETGPHEHVQPRTLLSTVDFLWLVGDRYRPGCICPAN